ncbi:Flp family type IVb pilin [Leptothrix sp. BB-3]
MEHEASSSSNSSPKPVPGTGRGRRKSSRLSAVEYALLAGLLAVVVFAALSLVGEQLGLTQPAAQTGSGQGN